jgi:hypothetical protein
MAHTDAFTSDNRTPRELAQAILDHEYLVAHGAFAPLNFGESLLVNSRADTGGTTDEGFLWNALKLIASSPSRSDEQWKRIVEDESFGGAIKQGITFGRQALANQSERATNGVRTTTRLQISESADADPEVKDWAAKHTGENAELWATAQAKLKPIGKLLQSLAQKLDIEMQEPRKGRAA